MFLILCSLEKIKIKISFQLFIVYSELNGKRSRYVHHTCEINITYLLIHRQNSGANYACDSDDLTRLNGMHIKNLKVKIIYTFSINFMADR